MRVKAGIFNPQVFLELLCYLVFGGLMVYLVVTEKYLSYVTPRMAPYLIFSAVIMGVFAIMGFAGLFRPQHVVRTAHCFVLAIPILLLLLPHSSLTTSGLSGGYVGNISLNGGTSDISAADSLSGTDNPLFPGDTSATQTPSGAQTQSGGGLKTALSGLDTANKRITVSNDEFYPWLMEIVSNLDKYVGYTISITGYVYRDGQYYAEDEFVPARLAMTCCAADLSPVGLLCKYDKASELTVDSWISVEGVIYKGQYEGQDEAQIHVASVTPAEKVDGYIYPY